MALALNIRADNVTAGGIENLWDQVGIFEDEPSMRSLRYRPHFTFAIYDGPEIDAATAWSALQQAAAAESQLRISFRRIRWFAGPPLVLWSEPEPDEALSRMHSAIHGIIDSVHCRPHYRPGAWVPHCTLGTRISEAHSGDAVSFARAFRGKFEVVFDVVDCLTFPPVQILSKRRLPPAVA
jgi:2'-5' RNA ligase